MTDKTCDQLDQQLVDYADGLLPPHAAGTVAAHLAECPRCHERLDALRRSLNAAHAIWSSTEAALISDQPTTPVPPARRGLWHGGAARVFAAAALLLLAIGLWQFAPPRPGTGSAVPPRNAALAGDTLCAVSRIAMSAQMLAAADFLGEQPGGMDLACQRYQYIASAYSDTEAAETAQKRLQTLCLGKE